MLPDLGRLAGELSSADILATVQLLDRCNHCIYRIKKQGGGELQRKRNKGNPLLLHPQKETESCNNSKCNISVLIGQWGVKPSVEWKWYYSIRSLESDLLTAMKTISLLHCFPFLRKTLSFLLSSPMKLAHPDYFNYCLPLSARAKNSGVSSLSSHPALNKQPHRHWRFIPATYI